jgi:hypothetical protein
MTLQDARWSYQRLIFSLVIIVLGTIALTFFGSLPSDRNPITGEFVLGQSVLFISVVVALLTIGILMLKASISR